MGVSPQEKYLLFGKNGWIGGKLIKLLQVRAFSISQPVCEVSTDRGDMERRALSARCKDLHEWHDGRSLIRLKRSRAFILF